MEEMVELAFKKILNLERLLERYFKILKVENELDFVLKGTYLFDEDLNGVFSGEY